MAMLVSAALGAAGCAHLGGEADDRSAASSEAPSTAQAREAIWRHLRVNIDLTAGVPRVISGCSSEERFVTCAVDFKNTCQLFSVRRVAGSLEVGPPTGSVDACLHVSGSLQTKPGDPEYIGP